MTLERRYLLNREAQAVDSATRIIELPRQGFLSAISLRFECTNGATAGEEVLQDAIDRVEVIGNGSEVLFSLEGVELYKWCFFWLKKAPPGLRTERASAVQELFLFVPFGRRLGDPEYNLNLAAYQRVELRVQHSPTISATQFVTATFTISAILHLWSLGTTPVGRRGWLRTTQVRAFTSAASGEDVFELQTRFPHVAYLVYAREAAIEDGVDITIAEVREEDGRVIPFTGRWLDIQAENQEMFDIVPDESGIALRADNGTIDTFVSRMRSARINLEQDYTADAAGTGQIAVASIAADRITIASIDEDFTAAAPISALNTGREAIHWHAVGIGIGNAIVIPIGYTGNELTPYDAPAKSKVQLALTQAGAGATVRASVQELVPG